MGLRHYVDGFFSGKSVEQISQYIASSPEAVSCGIRPGATLAGSFAAPPHYLPPAAYFHFAEEHASFFADVSSPTVSKDRPKMTSCQRPVSMNRNCFNTGIPRKCPMMSPHSLASGSRACRPAATCFSTMQRQANSLALIFLPISGRLTITVFIQL